MSQGYRSQRCTTRPGSQISALIAKQEIAPILDRTYSGSSCTNGAIRDPDQPAPRTAQRSHSAVDESTPPSCAESRREIDSDLATPFCQRTAARHGWSDTRHTEGYSSTSRRLAPRKGLPTTTETAGKHSRRRSIGSGDNQTRGQKTN